KLEGTRSNRLALGARVKVTTRTQAGLRDIYSTVTAGSSFGGSTYRREIGLGSATGIEAVEIRWPATGEVQVIRGLEMNRMYRIREDSLSAEPLDLRRFSLSDPKSDEGARR